ncbi:MAG TPA: hypothetical protein VNV35_05785 [Puia sp.]|jgi:hypothetical protein|nr:hypothetical protein [Puia sp.]
MKTTKVVAAKAVALPARISGFRTFQLLYQLLINSWVAIPAVFFYRQVSENLSNIPVMDDFNMPLEFVMKVSKADLWGKLGLIFGQYSEHRLVPSKLLYVAYYYLTGEINFRTIGIIGDLQLVMVAFAGLHFIRKFMPDSWKIPAIIWMLLVFDLNTYENADMCMNAVGNYGVCCYFFAALYFYDKSNKLIPLAILFQFLCIFSNGNGLAAGIFIVVFNFANSRRKLVVSSIVTAVFTGLYFINYHTVTLPNKVPFDINILITYFVRQAGAHFSFDNSMVIGMLILGLLIFLFPWRRIIDPKFAPILCIFLFSISTMVLAAVFRSCYKDAQFQTSRYLLYPQMMIGCLCIFLWMKLRSTAQRRIGGTILLFLMFITYGANFRFGQLGFERTKYRAETRKYWHPEPASAAAICKEACEEGIYCIDDNR